MNPKELLNIVDKAKSKNNHDELFDYLVETLIDLFGVDLALHFHKEKEFIRVINEAFRKKPKFSFLNQPLLCTEKTTKIFKLLDCYTLIINDMEKDMVDEDCKTYWLSLGVKSLIIYMPAPLDLSRKDICIQGGTMIACSSARKWTSEEIDLLKVIIDTIVSIYTSLKERQESEVSKRNYMATLTHDLRTPIVASQKAIEYILSQSPENSVGDFWNLLEGVRNVNEDLLLQINNLLSVYHFEAGDFEFHCEEFSLDEIVDESVGMMRNLTIGSSSQIDVAIEKNLPVLNASRGDIKRVLTNLLANAIKHNQPDTHVRVYARKKDNYIEVSISDNGQGVKKEMQKVLFERYVNLKGRTGSGLGLYLAKQIVNAHKGAIWFESEEGKGTTFYFTLPLKT